MTGDVRAMGDSLRGLALGDGFGERWFHYGNQQAAAMIRDRRTPVEAPFHYTDDTALALSIVRALGIGGRVDHQDLAEFFAEEFLADPMRGYGAGMIDLLPTLGRDPGNWATYARSLFGGQGSWGNGAAMRVAPLGAYFHADLDRVIEEAARSAEVTHAHPEGVAGAVAVAVAAALSAAARGSSDGGSHSGGGEGESSRGGGSSHGSGSGVLDSSASGCTSDGQASGSDTNTDRHGNGGSSGDGSPGGHPDPDREAERAGRGATAETHHANVPLPAMEFLKLVAELTPPGLVRDGLFAAAEVPASTPAWKASDILGNGQRVRASETVPFATWSAAHHPVDLESALWTTAEGLGDVDTTCAITGGIVGARVGISDAPKAWLGLREPLPDWAEVL